MRRLFLVIPLLLLLAACTAHNSIKIKGSDTEVNLAVLLAEAFRNVGDIPVSVSGGGSGLGIASLFNGNADIANSSRSISNEELELFRKEHIDIDSFIFAQDAIAIVVSAKMPIDSISAEHIARLFSGEYNNWSSITGEDLAVTIYGRQSNSGTHDYIRSKLGIHFSPYAKQMNGNAQILEAIKNDVSGIGYVGAGYVMNGGGDEIKVLKVSAQGDKALSPLDAEGVQTGQYYLQRPLYQYYRKADYEKVKPFLDFEKTQEGASIILNSGYYLTNK